MKPIFFALILIASIHSGASDANSVVFPKVNLLELSEATVAAVQSVVNTTMPKMVWSKDIGTPILHTISQDQNGDNTRYELEVEIEMKFPDSPYLFENICQVELDADLKVLYASCEDYEHEPLD